MGPTSDTEDLAYQGRVCKKHPELHGARLKSNHRCPACLEEAHAALQPEIDAALDLGLDLEADATGGANLKLVPPATREEIEQLLKDELPEFEEWKYQFETSLNQLWDVDRERHTWEVKVYNQPHKGSWASGWSNVSLADAAVKCVESIRQRRAKGKKVSRVRT